MTRIRDNLTDTLVIGSGVVWYSLWAVYVASILTKNLSVMLVPF